MITREIVYNSRRRPDCTLIKNELLRQGFAASTAKAPSPDKDSRWCVTVPTWEYARASAVVWSVEQTA